MSRKSLILGMSLMLVLSAGGFVLADCPSADLNGDCFVDFEDFAVMANQWLTGESNGPDGMVWVYIDDPGVSGHEGFTGYMSKYETTNGQYCEYLNAALADGLITLHNNIVYAGTDTGHSEPYFDTYAADSNSQITYLAGVFSVRSRDGYSMANHPVVEVSWCGTTAFCNYYGYRLPTEWEWQAVADYDGTFWYGCGTTIDHGKANYDWSNPLNLSSSPYTSAVDYYPSYGYGMNDMAGNVWEWTSTDSRGGGWGNEEDLCIVSWVYSHRQTYTSYGLGFRVCR